MHHWPVRIGWSNQEVTNWFPLHFHEFGQFISNFNSILWKYTDFKWKPHFPIQWPMTWTFICIWISNIVSGNEANAFRTHCGFCLCSAASLSIFPLCPSNYFFLFVWFVCLSVFPPKLYWKRRCVFSQHRCGFHITFFVVIAFVPIVSFWTGSHNCKRWIVKISRIHWWRYDRIFLLLRRHKNKSNFFSLHLYANAMMLLMLFMFGWNPMTIFISFHLFVVFRIKMNSMDVIL